MNILLITSASTDHTEWGNPKALKALIAAIRGAGHGVELLPIGCLDDLMKGLQHRTFDLVWSGVYTTSGELTFAGLRGTEVWVADVLDSLHIPYVGSNAATQKIAMDKHETNRLLRAKGIAVPAQMRVLPGEEPGEFPFPAFVKPCFSSESMGMNEESVVLTPLAMAERIRFIHETFKQAALVEEWLPGAELTASIVGNGATAQVRPIQNDIHPGAYERYAILSEAVKLDGRIAFSIPNDGAQAIDLTRRAGEVLGCRDHVRVDLRCDAQGQVKVIEVNGKPGLGPIKGRSLRIHGLYGEALGEDGSYRSFIETILHAACRRTGVSVAPGGGIHSGFSNVRPRPRAR